MNEVELLNNGSFFDCFADKKRKEKGTGSFKKNY